MIARKSQSPSRAPFNVNGFSFPGIPFVLVGKNRDVSWTLNPNNQLELEDLFVDAEVQDVLSNHEKHPSFWNSVDSAKDEEYEKLINEELVLTLKPSHRILLEKHNYSIREEKLTLGNLREPVSMSYVEKNNCKRLYPILDSSLQSVMLINQVEHIFLCSRLLQDHFDIGIFYSMNIAQGETDLEQSLSHGLDLISFNFIYATNKGNVGSIQTGRYDISSIFLSYKS